jgi:hypothetical protein
MKKRDLRSLSSLERLDIILICSSYICLILFKKQVTNLLPRLLTQITDVLIENLRTNSNKNFSQLSKLNHTQTIWRPLGSLSKTTLNLTSRSYKPSKILDQKDTTVSNRIKLIQKQWKKSQSKESLISLPITLI